MYRSHYPQAFNVVVVAYIAVDKSRPAEKGSLAKLGILRVPPYTAAMHDGMRWMGVTIGCIGMQNRPRIR